MKRLTLNKVDELSLLCTRKEKREISIVLAKLLQTLSKFLRFIKKLELLADGFLAPANERTRPDRWRQRKKSGNKACKVFCHSVMACEDPLPGSIS